MYDPAANVWTARALLPTARSAATAVVLNGLLYVVGGQDANGNKLATVEVYNPANNSWRAVSPLISARSFAAGGAINGQLYTVAGLNGGNVNQAYTP
jgi:N-acetylneuraminic acid mutarotase